MVINETISSLSAGIVFAIIFLSILLYMALTGKEERKRYNKIKRAKDLIEEGHNKALQGSRYDGIYKETRREKYQEEIKLEKQREELEKCKQRARKNADSDLQLLQ